VVGIVVAVLSIVGAMWAAWYSNRRSDETNDRRDREDRFADELYAAQSENIARSSEALVRADATIVALGKVCDDLRKNNSEQWYEIVALRRERADLEDKLARATRVKTGDIE
jgi:chromosome segregation ATPase